jgi:hypothetical protein
MIGTNAQSGLCHPTQNAFPCTETKENKSQVVGGGVTSLDDSHSTIVSSSTYWPMSITPKRLAFILTHGNKSQEIMFW